MESDPFARFEKSRAGWSIPLTIFLLCAAISSWALLTMTHVDRQHEQVIEAFRKEIPPDK